MSEENSQNRFNPREHLIQLKSREGSKDYLPVNWRLVWFREQCPAGTIETEIVHLDLDRETEEDVFVWNGEKRRSEKSVKTARGIAIVRATVKDGKGGVATGTKMEKAAAFGDWLEKAETGAIGRALAALGYGTQFAPDLDEGGRIVDAPVDRSQQDEPVPQQQQAPRQLSATNKDSQQPAVQPTSINKAPSVKALRKKCDEMFGSGQWDAVLAILFNAIIPDDNITPEQASQINTALSTKATEQQIVSIKKLCQHLSKPEPEKIADLNYIVARRTIHALTVEYKASRPQNKAS